MEFKECKKCLTSKDITMFPTITRNGKTYHIGSCRECEAKRNRVQNPSTRKLFYDGQTKECGGCGEVKLVSEFIKKGKQYTSTCVICRREYANAWYEKNRETHKERTRQRKLAVKASRPPKKRVRVEKPPKALKPPRVKREIGPDEKRITRHGITQERYDVMYAKHDGKCWACRVNPATCIDHDHTCCSGISGCDKCVRGLLCGKCNLMLGLSRDNHQTLQQAREYLNR